MVKQIDEWNAIDLHIHTSKGITRDKKSDEVNFSYNLFFEAVCKHNLKLISITNHNIIDFSNYILCKYIAEILGCNVLIGAELDTCLNNGKPIHMAIIANDNFIENYSLMKNINLLTDSKLNSQDEIVYNDDEIIGLISVFDILIIPHGEKSRGIFQDATESDIYEALKLIREGFIRIFDSPSQWKLERIKQFLKEKEEEDLDRFGGVLFSDVRDWNKYDQLFKNFRMMAEPTFKGLLHSVTNPTKRFCVNQEINRNKNYISKIEIVSSNERIEGGELQLSSGFNCVIGKSGSGKSLLLYLIKKALYGDKIEEKYEFSNDIEFRTYNENGKLLDNTNINISSGYNIYNQIITAISTKDADDTYKIINMINPDFSAKETFYDYIEKYKIIINKYVDYVTKMKEHNVKITENITKFNTKIMELDVMNEVKTFSVESIDKKDEIYSQETIQNVNDNKDSIYRIKEIIENYKGKRKTEILEKYNEFEKEFFFLLKYIDFQLSHREYENKMITIINNAINTINGSISNSARKKSELISEISNIRNEIVSNTIELFIIEKILDAFDLSINPKEMDSNKTITSNGFVSVKESFACDCFKNINIKNNFMFRTHNFKGKLNESSFDLTNNQSARDFIDKYIEIGVIDKDKRWTFNESFVPDVDVFFGDANVTQMNPGDIAKNYINIYFKEQVLNSKYSVVLFDQMENDVDKEFIATVIKDLIDETKGRVQLIVVTHDPIIAVNADPNMYIVCEKSNKAIKYRNFCIESLQYDETKTISSIVDGSKDIIRDRYEIYKGEINYEN